MMNTIIDNDYENLRSIYHMDNGYAKDNKLSDFLENRTLGQLKITGVSKEDVILYQRPLKLYYTKRETSDTYTCTFVQLIKSTKEIDCRMSGGVAIIASKQRK